MNAFDERHPHLATRAVVDALGCEAPRTLYRAFDDFNATHFANQLGAPLILITPASGNAWGDYAERDIHGLRSTIRIAPSSYRRGERFVVDVLLHEMVHAYQSEVDEQTEPGYRGHGPRFALKCNEMGARLGLPQVGVKGRKGLPDCAQWPVCVRPSGYHPKPEKKPKSPPPPPPTNDRTTDEENAVDDSVLARAVRRAYEAGRAEGEAHMKRHVAAEMGRQIARLKRAHGADRKLAPVVIAEAEAIARALGGRS